MNSISRAVLYCFLIFGFIAAGQDPNTAEVLLIDSNYTAVYNNPYIVFIRTALNEYLRTKDYRDSLQSADISVFRSFINDSLYDIYYNEKFSVLHIWPGDFGGIRADIIFNTSRNRIFRVWVYKIDKNEYQLRSIDDMHVPKDEIDEVLKEYGAKLFSKSL